jgi:hypothetical protein
MSYIFPIYDRICFSKYDIMRTEENHKGLELNGTYQLLIYDDCSNLIFGGNISENK